MAGVYAAPPRLALVTATSHENLSARTPWPYIARMDEMKLPPEPASHTTGATSLRERDAARADFLASVLAAEAEADRDGCVSAEEMLAHVRARLADKSSAAG